MMKNCSCELTTFRVQNQLLVDHEMKNNGDGTTLFAISVDSCQAYAFFEK